jgi:hypothetical protein
LTSQYAGIAVVALIVIDASCGSDAKRVNTGDCPLARFPQPEVAVDRDEILEKVKSGELSTQEASRLLAEADQPPRGRLYCKVSQKGAVSVYGLQRMPVTLYAEQWERLLDFGDTIRSFVKSNDAKLNRKDRLRDG